MLAIFAYICILHFADVMFRAVPVCPARPPQLVPSRTWCWIKLGNLHTALRLCHNIFWNQAAFQAYISRRSGVPARRSASGNGKNFKNSIQSHSFISPSFVPSMVSTYFVLIVSTVELFDSIFFGKCWQTSNENISPSVLNRIMKEVTEYTKNPVEDIVLQVNEENVTDLRAEITGPGILWVQL